MKGTVRPLIGIPCRTITGNQGQVRFGTLATYTHAVDVAGGAPLLIPLQLSEETLNALYMRFDGLLLPGGVDIHPKEFGEEVLPACGEIDVARDEIELCMTRWAIAEGKPVFGICRGIQVLNVAMGGSLYQDIYAQHVAGAEHNYPVAQYSLLAHSIELEPESRLARALGAVDLKVNSLHHQAVKDVAPGLRVTARAPDGIVEGVEGASDPYVVGVQFHPEWLLDRDERMVRLFKDFVSSASEFHARTPS
jgi:putative glutamine amidotransferase